MHAVGVLEHGMEQGSTRRRIWVKWYTPTKLGRWLILFLKPPEEIPVDSARKTIEELFQVYSSSIEVCEKYGTNLDTFHSILNEQYSKKTSKSTQEEA